MINFWQKKQNKKKQEFNEKIMLVPDTDFTDQRSFVRPRAKGGNNIDCFLSLWTPARVYSPLRDKLDY